MPAILFTAGLALGAGSVAAWALTDRPQTTVGVAPNQGDVGLKGPGMDGQPRRPVSVADVIGPPAPGAGGIEVAAGADSLNLGGTGAQLHKILARTLRREGKFEAASVAAARYRDLRLAGAP